MTTGVCTGGRDILALLPHRTLWHSWPSKGQSEYQPLHKYTLAHTVPVHMHMYVFVQTCIHTYVGKYSYCTFSMFRVPVCTYVHAYVLVVSVCTYCGGLILIIECDSTLYVGMTRKQNGGPIPPIHYNFAKNHIYEMCSFQCSPNTDDPHQWAMGKWDKWFDEVYAEYRASKWDVRVHLCYLPRHNRRTFHSLGGAQKRGLYDIY